MSNELTMDQARTDGIEDAIVSVEAKKAHILKQMTSLISSTDFNAQLSSHMTALLILSVADVEVLDAIPVRGDKNKKFYMFIHDKLPGQPNAYLQLIDVLDELRQTGASFVLKKVYYQ